MIHFRCSRCGVKLKVNARSAGRKRTCPGCGEKVLVPSDSTAVTPETWNPDGSRPGGSPAAATPSEPTRHERADSLGDDLECGEANQEDCSFLGRPQAEGELGTLGPFRVLEVLGSGATGIVFRAEDVQLRRKVALKVLRPTIAASSHSRRRFLREARAAAAFEHDNIVTIYQVGEDGGIPWLAMKLLRGESLKERLNGPTLRLPIDHAMRIGAEVADALSAAHSGGLVHRDVKPSNILLEEGTDRAKLIDFGLVLVNDDEGQLTKTGCVVGTPAYMAPEQADGASVDYRSDLYGLGCVLYRSTTGRLPFEGQSYLQVFLAQRTQEAVHPQSIDPTLPAGLSDLVMQLLSKNPADRPESARVVCDNLRALRLSWTERKSGPIPVRAEARIDNTCGDTQILSRPPTDTTIEGPLDSATLIAPGGGEPLSLPPESKEIVLPPASSVPSGKSEQKPAKGSGVATVASKADVAEPTKELPALQDTRPRRSVDRFPGSCRHKSSTERRGTDR